MDEKEFDFGHLTKEQALCLHRKLWNTVADKTLEIFAPVDKWEIFRFYNWHKVHAYCWCCEYAKKEKIDHPNSFTTCEFCPINWGGENKRCYSLGSPFDEWDRMMVWFHNDKRTEFSKREIEKLSNLARQIAELPKKE